MIASPFDRIDKWAIQTIVGFLGIDDVLRFKVCSKRIYRYVSDYLQNRYYKTDYLDVQSAIIETKLYELSKQARELTQIQNGIAIYKLHNNMKPYVYLRHYSLTRVKLEIRNTDLRWSFGIPTNFAKTYVMGGTHVVHSDCIRYVCIRKGQSQQIYEKTILDMKGICYIRVFIPLCLKKDDELIHMCFVKKSEIKNNHKFIVKYHLCKICKGDHTLEECDKVVCHNCKIVGHLTRRCPNIVCKKCNGNHLASRCKTIRCFKCDKCGHTAKRCRNK